MAPVETATLLTCVWRAPVEAAMLLTWVKSEPVEVPIDARLTTRLETPLSGISSQESSVSAEGVSQVGAVTVLVKVFIPVKV